LLIDLDRVHNRNAWRVSSMHAISKGKTVTRQYSDGRSLMKFDKIVKYLWVSKSLRGEVERFNST
jgi:hypothetical protein